MQDAQKARQTRQSFEPEPGQRLDYLLYLPKDYGADPERRWPLLLFLHGAGERGSDPWQVALHGVPKVLERGEELPLIVVSPQCPLDQWWTQLADLLRTLLDWLIERYPVDPRRIYLTGLSMGGFGSWELALRNPELFAAVAPVCGGANTLAPGFEEDLERLKDLPIWIFHGTADEVVPFRRSEELYEPLERMGANVRFTRYEDVGHNSWRETYDNPELYDWLLRQRRPSEQGSE